MPEDTNREQAERGELERAFETFNLLSSQLQHTYNALEQRVAKLTTSSRTRAALASARPRRRSARPSGCSSLLGTLPAGVVVVDENGCIQETNRVAARDPWRRRRR